MSYVDITILAIIALSALIGFLRGFGKSISGFIGTLVCAVVALAGTIFLAGFVLEIGFIHQLVFGDSGSLFAFCMRFLPDFNNLTVDAESTLIVEALRGELWTPLVPVTASAIGRLGTEAGGMALTDCVAFIFSRAIFSVIFFILLFVILKLIFSIIRAMHRAGKQEKVEGPKIISRFLGFLAGAMSGVMSVVIILGATAHFNSLNVIPGLRNELENSFIVKPISGMAGDAMENLPDFMLRNMISGIQPGLGQSHVKTPGEETAKDTLNVFAGFAPDGTLGMQVFSQDKFPRSNFTTANYNLQVQTNINEIENFLLRLTTQIERGLYDMGLDEIQFHALAIRDMYGQNENEGLWRLLAEHREIAKIADNDERETAEDVILAEINAHLNSIIAYYRTAFVGSGKVRGLTWS
jgi:uncharacterized membrane protein required for colicin V production